MTKVKEDYILQIDTAAERRFFVSPVRIEKRAAADGTELSEIFGYGALYDSPTMMGWYEESIAPGAFDDVLKDDVRALFNHDPNFILARTTSGTLTIGVDDKGLWYRYTTPDRSYAKDLQDAIESGDVSQSSFAFRTKSQEWTYAQNPGEIDKRRITKFERLYDVSPVTYPAYADTTVAKRSADSAKPEPVKRNRARLLEPRIKQALNF